MAIDIYNISLLKHKHKENLSPTEFWELCKTYNQHNKDLDNFLKRFQFNQWSCISLSIHIVAPSYVGKLNCNPAELLGILMTSIDPKHSKALKVYLELDPKLDMLEFKRSGYIKTEEGIEIMNPQYFHIVEDCPLWILEVNSFGDRYFEGTVILPSCFWDAESLNKESGGYEYTIDSEDWYEEEKNQARFALYRQSSASPNFIKTEVSHLPNYSKNGYKLDEFYDVVNNRLFKPILFIEKNPSIQFFDSKTEENIKLATYSNYNPNKLFISKHAYFILTDEGVFQSSFDFELQQKLSFIGKLAEERILYFYQTQDWNLAMSKNTIQIKSKDRNAEFSFSELGLNDIRWYHIDSELHVHAINPDYLILGIDSRFILIDAELNVENYNIKDALEEQMGYNLRFFKSSSIHKILTIKEDIIWIFSGGLVISFSPNQGFNLINKELQKYSGELTYYNACVDEDLGGIWMLVGLGRIVFFSLDLVRAYVFNTLPHGSSTVSRSAFFGNSTINNSCLFMDKDQNLIFATDLERTTLQKITRKELLMVLDHAKPYQK